MRTAILLLLASHPVGIARTWPKTGWLGAGLVLGASVLLADTVLDVLDLSPEGFWIAAGILLLVPAFTLLGRGDDRDAVGPASIVAAMAYATRDGTAAALLGAGLVAVAVLGASFVRRDSRWAGRAVGAAMVVLAFDLVRDGVIAV